MVTFVFAFYLGMLTVPSVTGLDADLHILITSAGSGRIFDLSLGSNNTIRTVSKGIRPIAVDFDPQEDLVYWTDVYLKQIRANSFRGLRSRAVLSLNNDSIPDGMAVDSSTRQIFYTDAGNQHIAVLDMNGTNHKIIINKTVDKPRAIVLHQEKRLIYWTDWGVKALIAVADYDGANRRHIVTSGLGWPNGLTLDKKNNKLYWCDGRLNKIESVRVDGTGRKVIFQRDDSHFFDIILHSGALYFTDWKNDAIFNIPADGNSHSVFGEISHPLIADLSGIHVFSSVDYSDCPEQTHGPTCEACKECKENSVCEKTTGHCLAGCKPGYKGFICDAKCPSGSYGDKCNSTCGMCTNLLCHHVTGSCPSGCVPGFTGLRCDRPVNKACPSNTYGPPCTPCGHCVGGVACDVVTGNCPGGCQPEWIGFRCDDGCNSYEYSSGLVCRPCGHCKWGVICNKGTGACPAGCQNGWTGSKCDHVVDAGCPRNTYGSNCVSCGHCALGTTCDVMTGYCPGKCQPGMVGDRCDTACHPNEYSLGSPCRSCGHCEGGMACDRGTGACHIGCQNGWKGSNCDIKDGQTDSQKIYDGPSKAVIASASSVGLVVVLVIVIIVIAVLYMRRKKRQRTQPTIGAVNQAYTLDLPPVYSVDQSQMHDSDYTRLSRPPPTMCHPPEPENLYAEVMPSAGEAGQLPEKTDGGFV